MKKIWLLRYNDGTADVWDEDHGPPSWPYIDAFDVEDALKESNSDYSALRARVARLEEALKRGIELHENCDADTCMCGESMLHPLADHKPTAMLQYYGDQWAEEARRALEEK